MKPVAIIIFINNKDEVLMQMKDKNSSKLFSGRWTLPEGSLINGELSGDLVKGIIEDNFLDAKTFTFFKKYTYVDKVKNEYELFVFIRKIHLDLLKITLYEGEKIDYKTLKEIELISTPEIILKIIKEYFNTREAIRV